MLCNFKKSFWFNRAFTIILGRLAMVVWPCLGHTWTPFQLLKIQLMMINPFLKKIALNVQTQSWTSSYSLTDWDEQEPRACSSHWKDHEVDLAVLQTAVPVPFALQKVNLNRAICTEHRDMCSTGRACHREAPVHHSSYNFQKVSAFFSWIGRSSSPWIHQSLAVEGWAFLSSWTVSWALLSLPRPSTRESK